MVENRILGPTADPQLADLLNQTTKNIMYNLNCVQLGTIELYNPLLNTAEISINFKRQLTTGEVMTYPLLLDCPVFILSGGDASIDMPIESGDQCIILFNDRNIDNWFYSGAVDVPDTPRAHNLSDGIALVGIRNLTTASPTSTTTVRIDAGSKKVAIKNAVANMKIIMDLFMDTLIAATVGPAHQPFDATTIAALTAVKVQWALLLDEGLV